MTNKLRVYAVQKGIWSGKEVIILTKQLKDGMMELIWKGQNNLRECIPVADYLTISIQLKLKQKDILKSDEPIKVSNPNDYTQYRNEW